MKKPNGFSLAMLISAAALFAAVSAPAVFAEDGHGGRGSDDVVTTATTIDDNDVNDDHGVDAAVTTTRVAPTAAVEDGNDAVDDND